MRGNSKNTKNKGTENGKKIKSIKQKLVKYKDQ